jgi:proteasome lid subunit RPN8/RPN11
MTLVPQATALCRPTGPSTGPTLSINRDDFNEMLNYAKAAGTKEVCGYAFVTRTSATEYTVVAGSVFITTQMVDHGAAEPDGLGEIEVMDREEELPEGVVRLLWHSHVDGQAGFSSTDLRTHDTMSETTALDSMFFIVLNKRGQASANFELYEPVRIGTQITLNVIDMVPFVDLAPYRNKIVDKCYPFPKPAKGSGTLSDSASWTERTSV